jgi:hypothetical protein
MARQVSVFEPWIAKQSNSWESSFKTPPMVDDPDVLAQWEGARDRAKKNAEWHLWGSGMWEPAICKSLLGGVSVADDRGILATFRPYHTERENSPDHGFVARRVAVCVNACAGIINPLDTIDRIRTLLFDLVSGRADASDPRILSLGARLIRPEPEEQHPGCCSDGEPP